MPPSITGKLRRFRPFYLFFFLSVFSIYILNCRTFLDGDTVPAMLVPVAIIRGDGPFLDRFEKALPGPPLPYVVTVSRGRIISRYTLGPPLLALPLVLPQVIALDYFKPGWDRDEKEALGWCIWMAKIASAAIAAGVAVALLHLLEALGLNKVALVATLATALGTSLWTIASQSLWQHGPACLALAVSISLLVPRPASNLRLFLAGGATALMVVFRTTDLIFAAATCLYLARYQRRGLAWFLPLPIVIGGLLISYNLYYFGNVAGGQPQLEALHTELHSLGPWSGRILSGAIGTLFSPSRGLFLFTPWIAVALCVLPRVAPRLRTWPQIS
jgi:hypothetical protein